MKLRLLDGQPEEFPYIIIAEPTKLSVARANEQLHKLGMTYHVGLPLQEVSAILTANGMSAEALNGIYCGTDGRMSEKTAAIGKRELYLHLAWHKMESGRFEIVAYVN